MLVVVHVIRHQRLPGVSDGKPRWKEVKPLNVRLPTCTSMTLALLPTTSAVPGYLTIPRQDISCPLTVQTHWRDFIDYLTWGARFTLCESNL